MPAIPEHINRAVAKVKHVVRREGNLLDGRYFEHERRYLRNIARISQLAQPGALVLDAGSHYLHQSAILAELGYRVVGMDVPEFAGLEAVRKRARDFGIENHAVDRFDHGEFLRGYEDRFDLVVFCEIQEHITFNPVSFWRRIYHVLKVGGAIYLTTPNALTPWKMASALKNLVLMRGHGIPIPAIVENVTYGHHWKEYSAHEIRCLFQMLSPDFAVTISSYQQRPYERWTGFKPALRDTVRRLSAVFPAFREELEAVVTLKGRTSWYLTPPRYF